VNFHNFNFKAAAAFSNCSQCWHDAATDSGARTIPMEKLTFTNVTKKIIYTTPWRAIYHDIDGTLTGKVKGWATPYWKHNHWEPECKRDSL